ncbi:MAG: hypothetical protein C0601_12980 [Candidatus Muiribacterium halophilum]|uniref:Uncharacterized protein n=1 Tax=Muiribacterium halophilum TaxID=2053465 RepID=A0A2N5Z9T7_MUIH1|nr:MAG: hypothetical protein C0601_12980 [Candidatus Muirbacterium halophilum]
MKNNSQFHTHNSKLFRQILFSYLPRIVSFSVGPILIALLTKNLSVEEFGIFTIFRDTCFLMIFIFGFGLNRYIANFVPGKKINEQYSIYKTIFSIEFLIFTSISLLIVIPFRRFFLSLLKIQGYSFEFMIFVCAFIVYIIYLEGINFLGYLKRLEIKSVFAFSEKVLYFLMILFLSFYGMNLRNISFVFLILHIVLLIFLIFFIDIKRVLNAAFQKNIIVKAFSFGLPLLATDIGWRVMRNVDRYILSANSLDKEVGIYAFGFKYVEIAYLVGSPVIWTIYPYLVESFNLNKFKDAANYLSRQVQISFYLVCGALSGLIVFRNEFVPLLSKKEYLAYPFVFSYMAICVITMTTIYIFQQIVILMGEGKRLGVYYLICTCLNILLNIILIPIYGIYGALIATVISMFLLSVLIILRTKKKFELSFYKNSIFYFLLSLLVILSLYDVDSFFYRVVGYLPYVVIYIIIFFRKILKILKN